MMKKKRAFTLIELITVLSIGAILLTISTNWYIINIASANNKNNKQIDLQSGVSASMEMIKNTLKKTTQAHLVGSNVYDPKESLSRLEARGLDQNYNYIAIKVDPITEQKTLVNLVYNSTKNSNAGGFESIPIVANKKGDILAPNNISYTIELYKNDPNYKEKMEKNILNITVRGVVQNVGADGKAISSDEDKVFELTEDVYLQNINQILASKFLTGGLDSVTAIAYDTKTIVGEETRSGGEMTFVFTIDTSGSMYSGMDGDPEATPPPGQRRYEIARRSIEKFIENLHNAGVSKNVKMKAYIFQYNSEPMINTPFPTSDGKYLYELSKLETHPRKSYGPLALGKGAPSDAVNKIITEQLHARCGLAGKLRGGATDTGWALLQSLEILNQARDRKANEKRFFILMTDGQPLDGYIGLPEKFPKYKGYWDYTTPNYVRENQKFISNREAYDLYKGMKFVGNYTYGYALGAMDYIKEVTDPNKKNNLDNTFDKAYLIGFSAVPEEKSRLGFPNASGYVDPDSIKKYLDRSKKGGDKNKVEVYDADSESALDSAFENVTKDIGSVIGVFDGPRKLN